MFVDVPGLMASDIELVVQPVFAGVQLRITGARARYTENLTVVTYGRAERAFGRFCRLVDVPQDADLGVIEACVHRGVLTIELPRGAAGAAQLTELIRVPCRQTVAPRSPTKSRSSSDLSAAPRPSAKARLHGHPASAAPRRSSQSSSHLPAAPPSAGNLGAITE